MAVKGARKHFCIFYGLLDLRTLIIVLSLLTCIVSCSSRHNSAFNNRLSNPCNIPEKLRRQRSAENETIIQQISISYRQIKDHLRKLSKLYSKQGTFSNDLRNLNDLKVKKMVDRLRSKRKYPGKIKIMYRHLQTLATELYKLKNVTLNPIGKFDNVKRVKILTKTLDILFTILCELNLSLKDKAKPKLMKNPEAQKSKKPLDLTDLLMEDETFYRKLIKYLRIAKRQVMKWPKRKRKKENAIK